MTAVAIIAEYNPFHTGHAYHISEAKRISKADFIVGIMSGCFVQRAEPAVVSPAVRATAAIMSGMDAVIEMPVIYSIGSGNVFAEGAVRIMSRIPLIKYLAMGVEDDGSILETIADIQHDEPEAYRNTLKSALEKGLSYPAAMTKATEEILKDIKNVNGILNKPNNVLAIEYLKALRKFGSPIRPIFIKREGNGYNDNSTCGKYISASAVRILLQEKRYDELKPYIPDRSFHMLTEEYDNNNVDYGIYNALTVNALRSRNIANALDCAEGLDKKIQECAHKYGTLSDILEVSKSKRYTMSRIKRICLQTLLGITKSDSAMYDFAAARLIAIKNACKSNMKHLTSIAVQNTEYTSFGPQSAAAADIDGVAGGIYSLITHRDGNMFWDRKLICL